MIGKTISHYEIIDKLGQGGMGVVYKARDLRLGRDVALKFLPPGSIDPAHRKRFFEEARTASLLQHPNICPIYDVEEVDGQLFFAMAYIEGSPLSLIIAGSPMEIHKALDIAQQVAAALDAAHRHGVVHRDIKSGNIMVNAEGHAYVLDFGLALRTGGTRLTVEGGIAGTPSYMSPEQAQGGEVDFHTDIWSLGVVLFEMLAGRVPFKRETDWAAVHAIIHDPLPPIGALRPEVSQPIADALKKALEKEPKDRWPSAAAMAAGLGGKQSLISEALTTVMPRKAAHVDRRRWVAAAAAVAVTASGGLGIAWNKGWLASLPKTELPEERHIAVLPFNVIGGDPAVQALADGLVETVTSKLSQLEQFQGKLLVIPASEIRARKITSPGEALKLYGANLVVSGSAELVGGAIQFSIILINSVKMRQIASKTFNFDVKNPAGFREGAMDGIVSLLALQLSPDSKKRVGEAETSSALAYSEYLRGTGYLARIDVKGNPDLAIQSFESAIKYDPNYAFAYSGLARACIWRGRISDPKLWSERSLQAAQKAVQLAPDLPDAHISLGEIYKEIGREQESISELQRALQLAPGNADAYRNLAIVLANLGRFQEAESLYKEAVQRRPIDWLAHLHLGLFVRARGRYKEAEAAYRQAMRMTPDNVIVLRNLGTLYRAEGRYPEAREQLSRALEVSKSPILFSAIGVVYYYEHRFQEAISSFDASIEMNSQRFTTWGNLAMACQWDAASKNRFEPAARKAIELASRAIAVTPKDYIIRADLAEYHARLGESKQALEALELIPPEMRSNFAINFALVNELCGRRSAAIHALRSLPTPLAFHDIKNDPSLKQLWADPELQAIVPKDWNLIR